MKNLVLVRHAESEWGNPTKEDVIRKLTEKGKSDAMQIAIRLTMQQVFPEKVYSSIGRRAIETAGIFLETFKIAQNNLIVKSSLYEPSLKSFYDVVEQIPDDVNTAFIVSHNPGITEFINDLDCYSPIQMPPCGVFALEIKTNEWAGFRFAAKQFGFYFKPQ